MALADYVLFFRKPGANPVPIRAGVSEKYIEHKEEALLGFATGEVPVLVTKPTIAGHGMNFQRCARMAFVGLSHSWESYYQAIRRCWRYGQTRPVDVHDVATQAEAQVLRVIERR